jgi:AcrR family transcriptional regulator
VPKLWKATIEAHRRDVREAILDRTLALVARHGPWVVTMSQIAEDTGIGRATLYKYFPDVQAILLAWHERQVAGCLSQLGALKSRPGTSLQKLEAMLHFFALTQHEHHGSELALLVHRRGHVAHAEGHLRALLTSLLREGAKAGELRTDVAPDELATYCLHAMTAASALPSKAAVHRLVTVTLAGLRAP